MNYKAIVIKLLFMGGLYTTISPVSLIIKAGFFGTFHIGWTLTVGLMWIAAGFGAACVMGSRRLRELPNGILFSTLIFPAAASWMIYRNEVNLRVAYEVIMSVIFYYIGVKGCGVDIFSEKSLPRAVIGTILVSASILAASGSPRYAELKLCNYLFAYAFMAITLLEMNRLGLNYGFYTNSGSRNSNIPGGIGKYNTRIVIIIFSIIILLLNLKDVALLLIHGVIWVLKGAIWLAGQFFDLLYRLQKDSKDISGSGLAPRFAAGDTLDPLRNLIQNIIGNFIALYLTYRFLLILVKMVAAWVNRFVLWLKSVHLRKETIESIVAEDYIDEIEIIRPGVQNSGRMKKTAVKLKGIIDPAQRVRYMYGSIVALLVKKGVDISRADTTGQICSKSVDIEGLQGCFEEITPIYDKVRYGEEKPGISQLETAEANYTKAVDILEKR